jgi:hypothetical protein
MPPPGDQDCTWLPRGRFFSTAAQGERRPRTSVKRQSASLSPSPKNRYQSNSTIFFQGNYHYLCGLSEPTLGKTGRHPPYEDKHDKGYNTCCLITLDKETKSKAKGDFYKEYTTTNQQKGQGQNTHLTSLDEYTKSKTKRREYLKKQEPTSKRDKGLGLQLLLLHKTTCIKNERKTRSSCVSTRLQTSKTLCKANRPSTS